MEGMTYVILTFISLLLVYLLKKKNRVNIRGKQLPGPSLKEGLITFVMGMWKNNLHLYAPKWAEKYGDLFQLNMLVGTTVFINDVEIFRRLVNDADYRDFTNDRPDTFIGKYYMYEYKDIILHTKFGPILQEKRKIFHNILKFYGESKGQFEELMLTSLKRLTDEIETKESVELSAYIKNYIRSLVGFLLDGDISDGAKTKLATLQGFTEIGQKLFLFENEALLQTFPFLRFVPGLRFKELHYEIFAERQKVLDAYFYPRKMGFGPTRKEGMVDELLALQQEYINEGSNFQLDDETIKGILLDIQGAAYATTSSTLSSLFLYIIKYPNIQDRVYEEIKRVIGDSTPSFHNRSQMPFTEAVILETMRLSSNVPFLLPHMVRKDIVFDGYFIPKSTMLMMNAWHCHHREDYWDDPFTFKPERFLDGNGQLVDNNHPARQRLISFGTGRRGCPGEAFAKSRVFMVTVFLLQKFNFYVDEMNTLPSSDPRDWKIVAVLRPDDYSCKIKRRCN